MQVWHYTSWSRLGQIVTDGHLKPSRYGAGEEEPSLWFSAHPFWEPTASKLIRTISGVKQLSMKEMSDLVGCVRFGLPPHDSRLLRWQAACYATRISEKAMRCLEDAARKQGSRVDQWSASLSPVDLAEARFQVWLGRWEDADPRQMADVWATTRGE